MANVFLKVVETSGQKQTAFPQVSGSTGIIPKWNNVQVTSSSEAEIYASGNFIGLSFDSYIEHSDPLPNVDDIVVLTGLTVELPIASLAITDSHRACLATGPTTYAVGVTFLGIPALVGKIVKVISAGNPGIAQVQIITPFLA